MQTNSGDSDRSATADFSELQNAIYRNTQKVEARKVLSSYLIRRAEPSFASIGVKSRSDRIFSVEDETTEDADARAANSNHHSEVEKRRRDRMNSLLNQLALLVPSAANKKYDKLTVLRLALQYINTLQNSSLTDFSLFGSSSSISYKDLREILEKSGDHVLLLTSTQTAEIINVGENISEKLPWTVNSLCNRSWIDVLHPDDIKPFLKFICFEGDFSASDADNDEVPLKSLRPSNGVDQTHPSLRRLVVVRMAKNPFVCGNPSDNDDFVTVECHVAIGNPQTKVSLIIARPVSPKIVVFVPFTIIINNVARIQRVDEAISNVTDKLPHDLIGSSYYDLIYDGDLLTASQLQKSIQTNSVQKITTYRIRSSRGKFVTVTAIWKPFTNPLSKRIQFITIKHFPRIIAQKDEQDIRQSTLKQMLRNHNDISNDGILGVGRYGHL